MEVSIIIVNYNTLNLTRDCIDSIIEKTHGLEYEIILVDNASTDGSKEYFSQDKRIIYVYNDVNLGFGRANNIGFKYAKGKYVFLLNSDTYLVNNAIAKLVELYRTFNTNGDIACAGCMLTDANNQIAHSFGRYPSKLTELLNYTINPILKKIKIIKRIPSSSNYCYEENKEKKFFDVDYITGADLFLNKNIALRYGLFDNDFFMYWEETEMQYRFHENGYRSIIINGPQIVHLEGKSNKLYSPQKRSVKLKSFFMYVKKTSSPLSYYTYKLFFKVFYSLFYIVFFLFINGNSKDKIDHLRLFVKM